MPLGKTTMIRIQFDGFTIEIGRDRSAPVTSILHAAMPWLFELLQRNGVEVDGFGRRSPAPPPDEPN